MYLSEVNPYIRYVNTRIFYQQMDGLMRVKELLCFVQMSHSNEFLVMGASFSTPKQCTGFRIPGAICIKSHFIKSLSSYLSSLKLLPTQISNYVDILYFLYLRELV